MLKLMKLEGPARREDPAQLGGDFVNEPDGPSVDTILDALEDPACRPS
jgi:hypothetical protein